MPDSKQSTGGAQRPEMVARIGANQNPRTVKRKIDQPVALVFRYHNKQVHL
jgi:hypothetical protein